VSGDIAPLVKRQILELDNLSPARDEVKKGGAISPPYIRLNGLAVN
jgi:hypothetical protein